MGSHVGESCTIHSLHHLPTTKPPSVETDTTRSQMSARSVLGKLSQLVRPSGQRSYSTPSSAEARWANYFPHTPEPTAEKAKKSLTKEMIGFMLLGPAGIGFMIYDFVIGLEEEHDVSPGSGTNVPLITESNT